MNNLSDLYDAKVGDKLTFPFSIKKSDIAKEIFYNEKLAIIDVSANNWLVTIVNAMTTGETLDLIFEAECYNDPRVLINVPYGVKPSSFKSSVYNRLKDVGLKRTVRLVGTTQIRFDEKKTPFYAENYLIDIPEKGSIKIPFSTASQSRSMTQLLYKAAKLLNMKIKIKSETKTLDVSRLEKKDEEPSDIKGSYLGSVNKWLAEIPFDTPLNIPVDLIRLKSQKTFLANMSKSNFDCVFKNGKVTKKRYMIRRIAGQVVLRINGETVKVLEGVNNVSDMKEKDWKMVDIILSSYGLSR